jgi:hypothetical protein
VTKEPAKSCAECRGEGVVPVYGDPALRAQFLGLEECRSCGGAGVEEPIECVGCGITLGADQAFSPGYGPLCPCCLEIQFEYAKEQSHGNE